MILRDDSFRLLQRRQPPLDLEIFVAGDAFDDPSFFDQQLEFTRLIGITIAVQIGCEVDTAGRNPIAFNDTLVSRLLPTLPAFPAVRAGHLCQGVSHFMLLSPRRGRSGF